MPACPLPSSRHVQFAVRTVDQCAAEQRDVILPLHAGERDEHDDGDGGHRSGHNWDWQTAGRAIQPSGGGEQGGEGMLHLVASR